MSTVTPAQTTKIAQARQPAGTPVGGQFAGSPHPDGPDLQVSPQDQLAEVLRDQVGAWAMDHLGSCESADVLDVLGIDEDQAVEQYGEDLGGKLARLTVVVDTETAELWPASLEGPAEYTTSGHVSILDTDRKSFMRLICSAQINGEDSPELPPLSTWLHRVS